jgi:hypothetical protein
MAIAGAPEVLAGPYTVSFSAAYQDPIGRTGTVEGWFTIDPTSERSVPSQSTWSISAGAVTATGPDSESYQIVPGYSFYQQYIYQSHDVVYFVLDDNPPNTGTTTPMHEFGVISAFASFPDPSTLTLGNETLGTATPGLAYGYAHQNGYLDFEFASINLVSPAQAPAPPPAPAPAPEPPAAGILAIGMLMLTAARRRWPAA